MLTYGLPNPHTQQDISVPINLRKHNKILQQVGGKAIIQRE